MTKQQFIHRHKRPPTRENIFLLGMLAGASLVAIAVCLCHHYATCN
ncbi:MAG TPA: hypothetical protein VGY56_10575 [Verrucomicrobiae bacterium]|nr:hypothetical protein [Verrucomicrobiae bacterium]